jgi:hypothetical protein
MNNMIRNALLALVLGLSIRGYGQSACAQLGVNCSHPNIQQTQPSSRPTPHYQPPPDSHYQPPPDSNDYASSATDAVQLARISFSRRTASGICFVGVLPNPKPSLAAWFLGDVFAVWMNSHPMIGVAAILGSKVSNLR